MSQKATGRMRPFPADADKGAPKGGPQTKAGSTTKQVDELRDAAKQVQEQIAEAQRLMDSKPGKAQLPPQSASPVPTERRRLESAYQAHQRVTMGSISSKPTAAKGLPATAEPEKNDTPQAMEDAMRQAWTKVFGKKG